MEKPEVLTETLIECLHEAGKDNSIFDLAARRMEELYISKLNKSILISHMKDIILKFTDHRPNCDGNMNFCSCKYYEHLSEFNKLTNE
jgi:hypothetical protein